MKQRKPLKPGDQVKFVGFCSYGHLSKNFETVKNVMGDFLLVGSQGEIHRRQVTHIKVKKPRIEFYIRVCSFQIEGHKDIILGGLIKPALLCSQCRAFKVREIKS